MIFSGPWRFCMLLSLALPPAACFGAADGFVMAGGQGPACKVVMRSEPTPAERTAVKLLTQYIRKSTGVTLETATTSDALKQAGAIICLNVETPTNGADTYKARWHDGFSIVVTPERIDIVGNNPPSLIYAVSSFLEKHLGIRWLAPGDLWTVVPQHRALVIPAGRYAEQAAFPFRGLHITYSQQIGEVVYPHWHFDIADWMMHNKINRKLESPHRTANDARMEERGLAPYRSGHSMGSWIPNGLFYEDHPEFFAFNGGSRSQLHGGGTQLDYSNAELTEVFARRVEKYLRDRPRQDILGIAPNDGYGFSCDPRARSEWFFDDDGKPVLSDHVFGFSSRVAAIVARSALDVLIMQYAYTSYYRQPPRLAVAANMGVDYCFWRFNFVQPMCQADDERSREVRAELTAWKAKTPNIIVREYIGNHYADVLMASGVKAVAEDMRWCRKMGFLGSYTEYSAVRPIRAREMMYIFVRSLWNPDADEREIIKNFYAAAYGAAAGKMLDAYAAYEQAAERGGGVARVGKGLASVLKTVGGFEESMLRMLDEAAALAKEESEQKRIKQVREEFVAFMGQADGSAEFESPPKLTLENLLLPANAAPNPSFEDALEGWSFRSGRPGFHEYVAEGAAWHGNRALAITCTNTTARKGAWTLNVPVQTGQFYEVQIMWKPDQAALENFAAVYMHVNGIKRNPLIMRNRWAPAVVEVKANSDKLNVRLEFFSGVGTVYFDGLSVRKMPRKTDGTIKK